jgi:hypothetical protein
MNSKSIDAKRTSGAVSAIEAALAAGATLMSSPLVQSCSGSRYVLIVLERLYAAQVPRSLTEQSEYRGEDAFQTAQNWFAT